MSTKILTVFLVLIFSTCTFAGTGLQGGNEFWNSCHEDSPPAKCWDFFYGMSSGIDDAMQFAVVKIYRDQKYDQYRARRQGLTNICFGEDVNYQQAFDVFMKFLKDNPQERDRRTGLLYLEAMGQAFPCNKAG